MKLSKDWKSEEPRFPMKQAPKDGTMIILTIWHGWSGEEVEVPGCWMMPSGEPSLLGWWAAGAVNVNGSELPWKISHSAVTPKKWRPLTHRVYGRAALKDTTHE